MTSQTLYVTEPDVIDIEHLKSLLPDDYFVFEGLSDFGGNIPASTTTLVIRSQTAIGNTIKDTFPDLQHIIRIGVGVDKIDVDFCNKNQIAIYNAPGANADAVSDYVVAMVFMAVRKTHLLDENDVRHWNRFKFVGNSMASRSIGIVGFGNIGRQIFTKLQSFGCKDFFIYDPFVKKEDLPSGVTQVDSVEDVLRSSNVVTLHVPLLPSTKELISSKNLNLLADGSVLVNASRGGIVNEADVVKAVRDGSLVYVADTVENEPDVSPDLLSETNIIVTPHIASLTQEAEQDVVSCAVNNFLQRKPMNTP